ncbi:MAG: S8 family serine peptidase [Campylobacterota bacterium]|nr:S8 family serine peptidase [Campylobacterota bacterium]
MIIKTLITISTTLFLLSCGNSGSDTNMIDESEQIPLSLSDSDSDGLADRYESALGLVVGERDADYFTLDPLYQEQWHLNNSIAEGEDINVAPIWRETLGEKNITVAIVDTGVDVNHSDISLDLNNSFRYSDNSNDPSPTFSQLYQNSSSNAHGTACAGIVAAKGWNSTGMRGVAPNINLVGLNVFSSPTDANFASALLREGVDVSSNSWGGGGAYTLYDDRTSLEAIESGVETLRDGKGVIYVFASGNDSANANFQSILASGYVVAVSSVNEYGEFEEYSDFGANILVCAPGGSQKVETQRAIVTTDISGLKYGMDVYKEHWDVDANEEGDYTKTMNGTSASCPMVSGVVGLMLSVNSELSYMQVQKILALSARKNDLQDASWQENGAGLLYSEKYGFGVVDATDAVEMARDFGPLGDEQNTMGRFTIDSLPISQDIKTYRVNIEDEFYIQNVQLNIATDHDNSGKLKIVLISPSGAESTLAYGNTVLYDNYSSWKFLSVAFLNESARGQWSVRVEDMGTGNSVSHLALSLDIKGHKK